MKTFKNSTRQNGIVNVTIVSNVMVNFATGCSEIILQVKFVRLDVSTIKVCTNNNGELLNIPIEYTRMHAIKAQRL